MITEAPRRSRFSLRRRRDAEERTLDATTAAPLVLGATAAGETVTPRGALAIADAYACIRALADAAASLPLHVFRRTGGGRERVENRTADLLRRPAPAVTGPGLVAQMVAQLNLYGNAYVAKYRGPEGDIEQLGLLSPERVTVEVRGGMPFYTVVADDGRMATYGTADIVHIKGLSLDGLVGCSPVAQAREALGLSAALTEFGGRFVRQGARPTGVLKVPAGPGADDQMQALERAWGGRHGGPENAGKVAVLSGEVTFEAVSMPLSDAQFLQQREFSTREVARVFRVPAWTINGGTADSLTYSTVSEQNRAFVSQSVRPWLVYIEAALTADEDLFPAGTRTYTEFDLDGLLRADAKSRADVYTAALNEKTGWMNRDEVRALENLPAEPAEVVA